MMGCVGEEREFQAEGKAHETINSTFWGHHELFHR